MNDILELSCLGHTWIIDLDGTLLKHNGYLLDGKDTFLEGAKEFLDRIPKKDMVVLMTSRKEEYKEITLRFLEENAVHYDHIIFGCPYGERIIVNDNKPSGLHTGCTYNKVRNSAQFPVVVENRSL